MKKTTLIIYLCVVGLFILLTLDYNFKHPGGIEASVVAGIGFGSIATSLIPFFWSRYLFTLAESRREHAKRFRIAAFIVYLFCFPVKTWAICVTMYLMIHGEQRWAFG